MALGQSKGIATLASGGAFDGAATTKPCDVKKRKHNVDVISIDEFVENHGLDVGLIKLDVEGAEYDTILGAKKTILKQKPLLIIAIYHSIRDFFEIKPLIESWDVGYKFTIRNHLPSAPDTDFELLAYCEEVVQKPPKPKKVEAPKPKLAVPFAQLGNDWAHSMPILQGAAPSSVSILERDGNF